MLAGERGPSYTDLKQIRNFKLIHVRFFDKPVPLGPAEPEDDIEDQDFPPAFSA